MPSSTSARGAPEHRSGGCMHHPCRVANPDRVTAVDVDPRQGGETLRALLASGGGLLPGAHCAAPTAGRLEADGQGLRVRIDPR
jgi:hypothetical protein